MGGGVRFEISQTAYVKLVLHALKYKTEAVNGILIGKVTGDGSGVEIVDAIPLFHGQLGLLPMLELALSQVDEYLAAEQGGMLVAGYYHANERFDDYELGTVARKIGDQIARYCPQAGVLLLQNQLLGSLSKGNSKKPVVQLYTRDSSRGWQQVGDPVLKEPTANSILREYILEERDKLLIDYDEHLDDIRKDWLNPDLFR